MAAESHSLGKIVAARGLPAARVTAESRSFGKNVVARGLPAASVSAEGGEMDHMKHDTLDFVNHHSMVCCFFSSNKQSVY